MEDIVCSEETTVRAIGEQKPTNVDVGTVRQIAEWILDQLKEGPLPATILYKRGEWEENLIRITLMLLWDRGEIRACMRDLLEVSDVGTPETMDWASFPKLV